MNKYILVTNNPMAKEKKEKELTGKKVEIKLNFCEDLDEVMTKTRDLIHKGYDLISHPLAGSVKPAQNPYRSILVKKGEALNYDSLKTIESAIQKVKQFQKNKEKINYPSDILEDYQVIDYSLIKNGIKSLK